MTLVAVTKGVPVEWVRDAAALGLTDFGENRVQEARAKQAALGLTLHPVRWHLIGHLQRNKVRHAVEHFDLIHSVDSVSLIEALEAVAGHHTIAPLGVLVQVSVSGEATKFGCRLEETASLVQAVTRAPHLRVAGLMTMAPFAPDPEQARPHFRRLRQLRDDVVLALNLEPRALSLSMGMSQDFEVAIEEGADLVRIGTAIFGPREHRNAEWGMRNGE